MMSCRNPRYSTPMNASLTPLPASETAFGRNGLIAGDSMNPRMTFS